MSLQHKFIIDIIKISPILNTWQMTQNFIIYLFSIMFIFQMCFKDIKAFVVLVNRKIPEEYISNLFFFFKIPPSNFHLECHKQGIELHLNIFFLQQIIQSVWHSSIFSYCKHDHLQSYSLYSLHLALFYTWKMHLLVMLVTCQKNHCLKKSYT